MDKKTHWVFPAPVRTVLDDATDLRRAQAAAADADFRRRVEQVRLDQLWIRDRARNPCQECGGEQGQYSTFDHEAHEWIVCPRCRGSGIEPEPGQHGRDDVLRRYIA